MNDTSDGRAVCITLLRLVDNMLGRYPTGLKDDAAALHRDRPMPHRWVLLLYGGYTLLAAVPALRTL